MHQFSKFLEAYGTGHDCQQVDPDRLEAHKGKLPDPLLEFWSDQGICGYLEGMFWFVDPDAFVDVLEEWGAARYTSFARNGFGDIFLYSSDGVSVLSVHRGALDSVTPDIELFLNRLMTITSVMDDMVFRKLHRAVTGKLGRPAPDECYGFVPALALGGPGTPETVQRMKLREHLSLLAQIHGH
ncbi:MAG TPA: GAD-like domain-containing protein [Longimicrobium sp.]|jgi:hypothetical protein